MTKQANKILPLALALLLEVMYVFGSPGFFRWLAHHGLALSKGSIALGGVYLSALLLSLLLFFSLIFRLRPLPVSSKNFLGSARALPIFLGLFFPVALAGRLLDPSFDRAYASVFQLTTRSAVMAFLAGLPFFLLAEEIVIRSLQRATTRLIGVRFAVTVTAVNFAILHLSSTFRAHAVFVFGGVMLGAVVLGVMYEYTKNFLATWLLHVFFDTVIVMQIFLHVQGLRAAELVLWIVFAALFLATFRPSWRMCQAVLQTSVSPGLGVWAVALGVGIVIPLLLIAL